MTIIAFVFCASVWSLSMAVLQVYARIFSASKSSWCTQAGQKSKAQLRGFSDFLQIFAKKFEIAVDKRFPTRYNI